MSFLDKFDNSKNIRFDSFKKTFEICEKRNLKIIVETGTSRGKKKFFFFNRPNWKDGMSTIMFAEYVKNKNGQAQIMDLNNGVGKALFIGNEDGAPALSSSNNFVAFYSKFLNGIIIKKLKRKY